MSKSTLYVVSSVLALNSFSAMRAALLRIQAIHNATSFGDADDRLSRICSEILRDARGCEEAYEYDSHFDGGEFSGPALHRAHQKFIEKAIKRYGYESADELAAAITRATSDKVLYFLFGDVLDLCSFDYWEDKKGERV